jgi:natural product biosynthesis luciferase-like monooxygenase protein
LWQGESVETTGGDGRPIRVRTYPTPVQRHLPIWITAAGSERTFRSAGQIGANLLTHLFDQDAEELARKIQLYRQERARHGHQAETGRVAVALHTYVADTPEEVERQARGPYADYLRSNLGLLQKLAQSRGLPLELERIPEDQLSAAIDQLFDKFLRQRSLLGTPDGCAGLVEKLIAVSVQEVCCLVDFGPTSRAILDSLPLLKELKDRFSPAG